MSGLTEQEKRGLEEVFLSISSPSSKQPTLLLAMKHLTQKILHKKRLFQNAGNAHGLPFHPKKLIKKPTFAHLFNKKSKKKKNLS
jgi:hypothetical protein